MIFLLIICSWVTFTVNIYEACDSSNLEILHILEINCVVISYSVLITALKIACPIEDILFWSSIAEIKKVNTMCWVFLNVTEMYFICPFSERFYCGSPFSHLLLLRYSFCHLPFYCSSVHLNSFIFHYFFQLSAILFIFL